MSDIPARSPASEAISAGSAVYGNNALRVWLLAAAALVLLTLAVGGITRMTNSGLSITEWKPVTGIFPPLSEQSWQEEFTKYKETYQFKQQNPDMTLSGFKSIYWWEWLHRLFARSIFLAILIPFLIFHARGMVSPDLRLKIFLSLGLVLLLGAIGWWMVTTGLSQNVHVAPYALTAHLGLAALLFAGLLGLALGQGSRASAEVLATASPHARRSARVIVGLVFLMIVLGALVAGHRGAQLHATWPLMEGQLVPSGLLKLSPWWTNLVDNALTIQFLHRLVAYGLFVYAWLNWRAMERRESDQRLARLAHALFMLVLAQILIGIVTVLAQAPLLLGLAHQLMAFLLLGLSVLYLYEVERRPVDEAADEGLLPRPAEPLPRLERQPRVEPPRIDAQRRPTLDALFKAEKAARSMLSDRLRRPGDRS
jgi:cytochrome c oxidase assembly protein subunit 15